MKRIIYSLYIDLDKAELDYQRPYEWDPDQLPKTEKTKLLFQEYYPWLKERQIEYANAIGIEYRCDRVPIKQSLPFDRLWGCNLYKILLQFTPKA